METSGISSNKITTTTANPGNRRGFCVESFKDFTFFMCFHVFSLSFSHFFINFFHFSHFSIFSFFIFFIFLIFLIFLHFFIFLLFSFSFIVFFIVFFFSFFHFEKLQNLKRRPSISLTSLWSAECNPTTCVFDDTLESPLMVMRRELLAGQMADALSAHG